MIRVAFAALLAFSVAVDAQQSRPTFDVASVRENVSGQSQWSFSPGLMPTMFGEFIRVPGQITINNAPLRDIIARAYSIRPELDRFVLSGGPEDILSKRFDIRAVPPEGAPADQTLEMLKALLQDRFKLKVRTEMVTTAVYALVVAREGRFSPDLKRTNLDCQTFFKRRAARPELPEPSGSDGRRMCRGIGFNEPVPGAQTMGYASDIDFLVIRIQAMLDRPVINATGLSGSFEWRVTWSGSRDIDAPAPSLRAALEEQLGLRLDERQGPTQRIVIESVEMPTPN